MSQPFLGEIKAVGFSFPPRGYASCAGQILSIAQNTALFSLLGTTYGGNGQVTFGLPNLGGRVLVGQGQSPGTSNYVMGETAGTEMVTLTQPQMPAHTHAAVVQPASLQGTGNATGNISIPANNAAGSASAPAPNRVLGTMSGGGYAGAAPNTTLEPFSATLPATVDIAVPANFVQIGISGSNLPVQILQPFQVVNYVIAIEGVFPSRN